MGGRNAQKRRRHAAKQQQKRARSPTASEHSSAECGATDGWSDAHGTSLIQLAPETSELILAHRAAVQGIATTATAAIPPISIAEIIVEPGAIVAAQADVADQADVSDVAPQHVHGGWIEFTEYQKLHAFAFKLLEEANALDRERKELRVIESALKERVAVLESEHKEVRAIETALQERIAVLEARVVELGSDSSPAPAHASSEAAAPAPGAQAAPPAHSAPAANPESLGPRAVAIETSLRDLLLQLQTLSQQLVPPHPVPPPAPAAPIRPAAPTTSWAAKAAAAPVAAPAPARRARGGPDNRRLQFVVVAPAGHVPVAAVGLGLVAAVDSALHAFMHADFTLVDARRLRPEPARGAAAPRDRFLVAVDRMWEADSLVAHRHMLKGTGVVVFDHLSREEQVAHARLLPAFRQAQASGAKAQFQRARLFVDRVEVR